jgi:hypothetical protein
MSVCFCVPASFIRHEKRTSSMPHFIVVCGLPGSTIFFHFTSQNTRFPEEKLLNKKACFDFVYNACLEHF